jgi:ABC-2 type transport system permease protein
LTTTLSASLVLGQRELIRFLRQRNRVIGALATPLMFWLLIGGGMGHSFAGTGNSPASGYLAYFFPGTVLMILLFTAIFSTISVIEDRREGFLQGVLVAPVGRAAVVGGKVLGGAVLATGQALLFVLLGWVTGIILMTPAHLLAILIIMFVTSLGLTALSLCIAWPMSSTQGFHVVMNLFLVPLWFLSGALFPLRDDTPLLLKALMLANPLSYALASLREVMWRHPQGILPGTLPMWFSVTLVATIAMIGLALWVARSRSSSDAV